MDRLPVPSIQTRRTMLAPGESSQPPPSAGSPAGSPPFSSRPGRRHLRTDDVILGITCGAIAVAWWPLVVALRGPRPVLVAGILAHVCGMLAGYGVLVLVALMTRAPALDRGVGTDALTRWHARGGRVVVGLIVAHAWAAITAWSQTRGQSGSVATWHVLGLPGLLATAIGTVLFLLVGAASARAARKRITYERWHALHLLTYIAVAMTFLHQLAGPDLAGYPSIQVAWATLYAGVFAVLIRYRLIAPLRQAARHRLRVSKVIPAGPGVTTIEITGEHLTELDAQSGQFFRWRFLTPDHWASARPFSLSAPPTDDRLRITVKALGKGSARLQDVEVGTWVLAEGPYGAMTADRRTRPHVLLIAGGVGITPMRTLFETMPLAAGQDLTLLYRVRSADDLLFRVELDETARRRGATVHAIVGDDPALLSTESLRHLVPDVAERDVYLCGPPPMAAGVRRSLLTAGLPPDRLHEERFSW